MSTTDTPDLSAESLLRLLDNNGVEDVLVLHGEDRDEDFYPRAEYIYQKIRELTDESNSYTTVDEIGDSLDIDAADKHMGPPREHIEKDLDVLFESAMIDIDLVDGEKHITPSHEHVLVYRFL